MVLVLLLSSKCKLNYSLFEDKIVCKIFIQEIITVIQKKNMYRKRVILYNNLFHIINTEINCFMLQIMAKSIITNRASH